MVLRRRWTRRVRTRSASDGGRVQRASPSLAEAARRTGWLSPSADPQLLQVVARRLRGRPNPRVALMHSSDDRLRHALLLAFPHAHVVSVAPDRDRWQRNADLLAAGSLNLLVDLGGDRADRLKLFRDTFGHLVKGGAYVVVDYSAPPAADGQAVSASTILDQLAGLLDDRLQEALVQARPPGRTRAWDRALGRTMAAVSVRGRHLVITKRAETFAKLHEADLVQMIRNGVIEGTVLQRPGAELVSRCELHENADSRGSPKRYEAPPLSLRQVRGVSCRRGQVAVHGSMLLPDSYRHHMSPELVNVKTADISSFHARLKGDSEAPQMLEGAFFHLSSEYPNHFGHTVTEQLSRLWAWDEAKGVDPDLKALLFTRDPQLRMAPWESDLFHAAGIAPTDVHLTRGPVRVERFVSATPMFSMPRYVHPDIVEVWNRVARNLAARATVKDSPPRIFCARRAGTKRVCRNTAELEQVFVRAGFTVVYPEEHSLANQVAMFQRADAVAGLAGSALFTMAFCEAPKRLIVIQSQSYTASNEYLISAVRGHRIDRFWCPSDSARPDRGWDRHHFQSPFEFDFDRDGDRLDETLASI